MNIREVADCLGVSEEKVRELVSKGDIPAYRIGGKFLRFRKNQIDALRHQWSEEKGYREAGEIQEDEDSFADRLKDFLYFNGFYIISIILIIVILVVIFRP